MTCSRCQKPHERSGQNYCAGCHAGYMRRWRKTHPVSEEQRKKGIARAYANVYERRGRLKKKPCKKCGDANSQKHHPDYSRPLYVIWLCRRCHLAEHRPRRTRETVDRSKRYEKTGDRA